MEGILLRVTVERVTRSRVHLRLDLQSDDPREARISLLKHNMALVRVTRVFEANSTAYMVMRFERGASFEHWLRTLGRILPGPGSPAHAVLLTALLDPEESVDTRITAARTLWTLGVRALPGTRLLPVTPEQRRRADVIAQRLKAQSGPPRGLK